MSLTLLQFIDAFMKNKDSDDGDMYSNMKNVAEWLRNNPATHMYIEMKELKNKVRETSLCALLQKDTLDEMEDGYEKTVLANDLQKNLFEIMELEYKIENISFLLSTKVFYNEDFTKIILDTPHIINNLHSILIYKETYAES